MTYILFAVVLTFCLFVYISYCRFRATVSDKLGVVMKDCYQALMELKDKQQEVSEVFKEHMLATAEMGKALEKSGFELYGWCKKHEQDIYNIQDILIKNGQMPPPSFPGKKTLPVKKNVKKMAQLKKAPGRPGTLYLKDLFSKNPYG
jgi:hypothetical protein